MTLCSAISLLGCRADVSISLLAKRTLLTLAVICIHSVCCLDTVLMECFKVCYPLPQTGPSAWLQSGVAICYDGLLVCQPAMLPGLQGILHPDCALPRLASCCQDVSLRGIHFDSG